MSNITSLTQPAYTNQFLQLLLSRAINLDPSSFPQPSSYQVNVLSSGSTVDQTTNVQISGYSDQFLNQFEITQVEFTATFSNTNAYEFNEVQFYAVVSSSQQYYVADFKISSSISKPSGYVLVLEFSFSISTPVQYINAIYDMQQLCSQQCQNVNCSSIASSIAIYFIPFSVLNFVFIYLLGVTYNYLQSLPNVQQQAQQYANCMNNCKSTCSSGQSSSCTSCMCNCISLLSSNPIAIYIVANNITELSQLGAVNSGYANAVNTCSGIVGTQQVNPIQGTINSYTSPEGEQGLQLVFSFTISNTANSYNAIEFTLLTANNSYYALGVLTFQGTALPGSATFTFQIAVYQTLP
jgi:hypothetical protein